MSSSKHKREEGEDETSEVEESENKENGIEDRGTWSQWVEWVHREEPINIFSRGIEPPNADIDLNRIKGWIQECRTHHGESCNNRYSDALAQHCDDLVLVDVIDGCIVNLPNFKPYVALSYVWGSTQMPKLRQSNYNLLKQLGQLFGQRIDGIQVPQVIQDAIYLVRNLGERYLWVDSLCVMQDASAEDMEKMLQAMARIYASAEFTIVAAGGSDADHGLRGIDGPSQSRIPMSEMYDPKYLMFRSGFPWRSVWASRGWTFQESTFARRLLVFDTLVSWTCGRCGWQEEDHDNFPCLETWPIARLENYAPIGIMAMITPYPSLRLWGNLVGIYSSRVLTHENDFVRAFAGATNIIGPTFPGGFIHGLPKFFLDIALLWEPWSELSRRPEGPSWSWTGWKGTVNCYRAAWERFDPGRYRGPDLLPDWVPPASLKSVAIFQEDNSGNLKSVDDNGFNGFYEYQAFREQPDQKLPDGWKRIEHGQGAYFAHPDTGGGLFRCGYPVPLALGIDGNKSTSTHTPSYLICTAPIATLSRGEISSERWKPRALEVALLLEDIVVGRLFLHCKKDMFQTREASSCELVAISEARIESLDEIYYPDHFAYGKPLGYSYYNVLWIHWEDRIAYRTGIGAVDKEAWDSLGAEVRTFKLG
jgi:hypothetical protein